MRIRELRASAGGPDAAGAGANPPEPRGDFQNLQPRRADSGTLLLIDAAGKQLRRIPYQGEPAGELLRRLSEPEEGSSGNTVNQGGEKS